MSSPFPAAREQATPSSDDEACALRNSAPSKPAEQRYDVRAAMVAAVPPFSMDQSTAEVLELVIVAAEEVLAKYDKHIDDVNDYYTDGILASVAECERRSAAREAEVRREVAQLFTRTWVCHAIFSSGVQGVTACTPDKPHGGNWACSYACHSSLTEGQFRRFFGEGGA